MTAIRSAENAEMICERIAEGFTLRQIAKELGVASPSAIVNWARDDEAFREQYARAKDLQADRFAEEIIEIADDGTNDWIKREIDGREVTVLDHEHIQRSKLRVDARRWLMAKMAPKKYGEKTEVAHTGPNGGPLETITRIELVPVEPKGAGE